MSNLLRHATAIGCRLVIGEDVVEELDTHLDRLTYRYHKYTMSNVARIGSHASQFEPLLIRAYLEGRAEDRFPGSFDDYVAVFKGTSMPRQDLQEFLFAEYRVVYDEMEDQRKRIDPTELECLVADWKEAKRKRVGVDEGSFEKLIRHDAAAMLLIKRMRVAEPAPAGYGHKWWWLVQDGTAFRLDRAWRTKDQQNVCMGPEFFARYASLAPTPTGAVPAERDLLPGCLQVSELGYIPPDLREEAVGLYEEHKGQPEYLRRRQLRDLVNLDLSHQDQTPESFDAE